MQTAEIIEGLQGALGRMTPPPYRRAIEAAIAALTPEPITKDGLRGLGFMRDMDFPEGVWVRYLRSGGKFLTAGLTAGVRMLSLGGEWIDLHITDMAHLRAVIAALEGSREGA